MANETTTESQATNSSEPHVRTRGAGGASGARPPRKWQEVKNDLPPVWEPTTVGETLEGIYVGPRNIKYRNSSFTTYVIQRDINDPESVISFSGAIPGRKFARIPVRSNVMVEYKGWVRTNNGDAKDFTIYTEEGVRLLDEVPEQLTK
jgi:hypothetical protein